jgi:hypothetical protein
LQNFSGGGGGGGGAAAAGSTIRPSATIDKQQQEIAKRNGKMTAKK